MKITALPTLGAPAVTPEGFAAPGADNIYAMKLKTNATPGPMQPVAPELPIQPTNRDAQATVEATQPLSPQLALLAKQRRALLVKERELDERAKALSASPAGDTIDIARLKAGPMRVMRELGIPYTQLTEELLAEGQGNAEIASLKGEIESLKQSVDKKLTDRDTAAEQQVLAAMRREADQLIKGDGYEFVRETNSLPEVIRLIKETYYKTGETLDVSEALQLYENELFEDAKKLAKIEKLRSTFAPPPQPQRAFGMRTLTNKDTASMPLGRRERALAAWTGMPIRR